jgi:hypothetical protein
MTLKMINKTEIKGRDKKYEWVVGYFNSIREAKKEFQLLEDCPWGSGVNTRKINARTIEIEDENLIITYTIAKA